MYKASIIVTLSNEYALTENFFSNLFNIINQDMDIFCVVDGETDRHTIQYLHELEKMHSNISIIYKNLIKIWFTLRSCFIYNISKIKCSLVSVSRSHC